MTEQLETEQKERGNLITERKKYLNLQMIITHNTANVILRNAPRKEYQDTKWRMYREIIIHKLHQFVRLGHCAPSRSRHDILLCFIVNLHRYLDIQL